MLMVVTDNMLLFFLFIYLFMRACMCFVFCCAVKFVFSVVLSPISSGPSRDNFLSQTPKKIIKNEERKMDNRKIFCERDDTFNTISTTTTQSIRRSQQQQQQNSGGIARNNSAVSALCF